MTEKHIVWHDLMTGNVRKAQRFYAELLGWQYETEHATDFAWGNGEADYPLIVVNDTAHGGMIDLGPGASSYWLPYLQVQDVDSVTAKAEKFGAKIERAPFDVPGVGRNAVIRDPQGALICPHSPTHSFPPPIGVFERDMLLTADTEQSQDFYRQVFKLEPITVLFRHQNTKWLPVITQKLSRTAIGRAEDLGGRIDARLENEKIGDLVIIMDSTGAEIGFPID